MGLRFNLVCYRGTDYAITNNEIYMRIGDTVRQKYNPPGNGVIVREYPHSVFIIRHINCSPVYSFCYSSELNLIKQADDRAHEIWKKYPNLSSDERDRTAFIVDLFISGMVDRDLNISALH